MFCKFCGASLRDGANFCSKCGKRLHDGTGSAPDMMPRWSQQEAEKKARDSYNALKDAYWYYCHGCGGKINRQYQDVKCRFCGAEVIGASIIGNAMRNGLLSMMIETSSLLTKSDDRSALSRMVDYYNSEFYKRDSYPFEEVVTKNTLIGKYLVDREYEVLRKCYPGRTFHVLYDLVIPNLDGTYEYIDAVIIYGHKLFVIKPDMQEGCYEVQHVTDGVWQHVSRDDSYEMVSPLMKNEQNINTLERYLYTAGVRNVTYYNCVTMAGGASFKLHSDQDAYDDAVLRWWCVYHATQLHEYIVESIQQDDAILDQAKLSLEQCLQKGEETAQTVIAALSASIDMSRQDRELLMRDQGIRANYIHGGPYRYYYVRPDVFDLSVGVPTVVRWNDIGLQITNYCRTWESDEHWHITAEGVPQYGDCSGTACRLDSSLQTAQAVACAKKGNNYTQG